LVQKVAFGWAPPAGGATGSRPWGDSRRARKASAPDDAAVKPEQGSDAVPEAGRANETTTARNSKNMTLLTMSEAPFPKK
jgi:hypothetical protein